MDSGPGARNPPAKPQGHPPATHMKNIQCVGVGGRSGCVRNPVGIRHITRRPHPHRSPGGEGWEAGKLGMPANLIPRFGAREGWDCPSPYKPCPTLH